MDFLKFTFLLTVIYFKCDGKEENPLLNEVEGKWIITNASKNAPDAIGDCSSVQIERSLKRSGNGEVSILYKNIQKSFTLTLVSVDKRSYEVYLAPNISQDTFVGTATIIKEEHHFLVSEIQRQDAVYFLVLTQENKTSPNVDKEIRDYWKSSSNKRVPLRPVNQENCNTSTEEAPQHVKELSVIGHSDTTVVKQSENTVVSKFDSIASKTTVVEPHDHKMVEPSVPPSHDAVVQPASDTVVQPSHDLVMGQTGTTVVKQSEVTVVEDTHVTSGVVQVTPMKPLGNNIAQVTTASKSEANRTSTSKPTDSSVTRSIVSPQNMTTPTTPSTATGTTTKTSTNATGKPTDVPNKLRGDPKVKKSSGVSPITSNLLLVFVTIIFVSLY